MGISGLFDSNLYAEGQSEIFKQLDKLLSVSDFLENVLIKDFNSTIFFQN